jgi:hypothetical protein
MFCSAAARKHRVSETHDGVTNIHTRESDGEWILEQPVPKSTSLRYLERLQGAKKRTSPKDDMQGYNAAECP